MAPRFDVNDEQFQAIVKAIAAGSRTIAAAELRHFAQCSEPEARAWVDHLLNCLYAWRSAEADEQVLRDIDLAFANIAKPKHFTDFSHCSECKHHDQTLRSKTRETLCREDLGTAGWDPVTFSSEEGIAYLFPALARFALLPDVWSGYGWYGSQLLSHLSYDGGSNRFLAWCSPAQRDAVYALLKHLSATRRFVIERGLDENPLEAALAAWEPIS
ncbi:hypothetical protein GCM10011487_06560 [Steroidobacter agaridevorans]|uniref:Uncharacterized protein n=1 Tax=Steroidobacter agaridevorans TaxID=2695856 RepID=A0A829Y797_9GAMM|nr:hypothetical protein GCM10011487_06560 [Steroidobacter agaridevorans]GFE89411.1 hypothetical protein GCM10011488_43650 [Steroidobacter agaridevorans]